MEGFPAQLFAQINSNRNPMRGSTLALVNTGIAAFAATDTSAFVRLSHSRVLLHHHRSNIRARSSSLSEDPNIVPPLQETQQTQQNHHPHSLLWSATLDASPNAYVNHSIDLAIRSPSQGGTGIVAVDDVPVDTVLMCLPLEEVSMIDAASILDSYNEEEGDDAVLQMLKEMWNEDLSATTQQDSDEGKRLAVLAGIIAHLQLIRFRDKSIYQTHRWMGASYSLEHSRRLGLFLDAMPLLPKSNTTNKHNQQHPFPTHFLYWTDDEVEILLQGTMAQTKAREVRAGIGLVVRKWSSAFLKEHHRNVVTQTQILYAILSAFTAVLSRSFGDSAGRDLGGKGRMLVPLVDMLNHDGEDPNVRWTWYVGEEDDDKVRDGHGNIVVTTLRSVKRGEELVKCYGWRPAWDIASSYGFVPELKKERWECAVIPLFPAELDVANAPSIDLLLESNYGPLVKEVMTALDSVKNDNDTFMELVEDDRPKQMNRIDLVSLFRPPPATTADKFPFTRRQPCVVVCTKIQLSPSDNNDHYHQHAIELIYPAFRAAASALSQLKDNYSSDSVAKTTCDNDADADLLAKELIKEGIRDRIQNLNSFGTAAQIWLNAIKDMDGRSRDHLQCRAGLARDVREAELIVLRTLQNAILKW
jgi:hypothetical protein